MRIKMGQTILEIGPRWHKSKEGTPTMGGIFFIGAMLLSVLLFGLPLVIRSGDYSLLSVFLMMVLYGAVGFIDDFVKFVKKQNKGLTAGQKLIFQFAIAALFLFMMKDHVTTTLSIPSIGFHWDLGIFYYVFALIFIALTVNAVNLTDGIDGLAAGTTFVVFVFFTAVALKLGRGDMASLFSSVCGGMIGFLIYNYHPARIFMGDTGSLFLGGAVVGAAFWLDLPLLVFLVGFVYLWEALSVVLQVFSFKTTGKRIFRMAPFHHHLEMGGWTGKKWSEKELFVLFTSVSLVFAIISFIGIYSRF